MRSRIFVPLALAISACLVIGVLVWQGLTSAGNPDPLSVSAGSAAGVLDIGVLVFREGLECILVLAAITASMIGPKQSYRRPIAVGAGFASVATLLTWVIAVGVIDDLTQNFSALQIQAVTGLLAIVVLLVVMNWFFHKVYWTGWIAAHTRKKQQLMQTSQTSDRSPSRLLWGLGMLGFTSLYREGFEVVLFLQNYRLKLGGTPVLYGVLLGLIFTSVVAVLTFVAHRRLPYRKMLVLTGVLLGLVLLVMVGEQAQEMQLAHWLPTTPVHALDEIVRPWMGLWFSLFPNAETIVAQLIAALLVLGSYAVVRIRMARPKNRASPGAATKASGMNAAPT